MAQFNAFISYSHAADGELAPAVQNGLQRLAKPWNRRRALEVFRDQTGLAVSPHLWGSIVTALDGSEWLVLMASPESAASDWVGKEIEHWLASSPAARERMLPVVTGGVWEWDEQHGGFTPESTAVHPALRDAFREEPRSLDLTWARESNQLDLRNPRFKDAIADLAAPIHDTSKDELVGVDVRQFKLARRLRRAAVISLATVTIGALVASAVAVQQRGRAIDQKQAADAARVEADANAVRADNNATTARTEAARARSRELAALALNTMSQNPSVAALLAVEANYPNGATSPIDVPEARDVMGVTLRSLQGDQALRSGPLAVAATDLLYATDQVIGTLQRPRANEGINGAPVVSWWDATTGAAVDSPLPGMKELRLRTPFGGGPNLFGEAGPPYFYDLASDTLLATDQTTRDLLLIAPDDRSVSARLSSPAPDTQWQHLEVQAPDPAADQPARVIALSTDGAMFGWGLPAGGPAARFEFEGPVQSFTVIDRSRIVVEARPGLDTSVDLTSQTPPAFWVAGVILPNGVIQESIIGDTVATVPGTMRVSPDGAYLAAGVASIADPGAIASIAVWQIASGHRLLSIDDPLISDLRWASPTSLVVLTARGIDRFSLRPPAVAEVGALDVAAGATSGAVVVATPSGTEWLVANDSVLATTGPPMNADLAAVVAGTVTVSPDGSFAARVRFNGGGVDVVARTDPGRVVASFPDGSAAAFAPSGATLAVSESDGIHLVSTSGWATTRTIAASVVASQLVWSADGTLLLARPLVRIADITYPIVAVDVARDAVTPVKVGEFDEFGAVAISPDGRLLALGATDGLIDLYRRSADGRIDATAAGTINLGPTGVTGLAFSPDGARLVASGQRTTAIWNVRDPVSPRSLQVVSDLSGLAFALTYDNVHVERTAVGQWGSVAFSPDGKSLVLAGASGVAQLADFDPALACRLATSADLKAAELVIGTASACTRVAALRP